MLHGVAILPMPSRRRVKMADVINIVELRIADDELADFWLMLGRIHVEHIDNFRLRYLLLRFERAC